VGDQLARRNESAVCHPPGTAELAAAGVSIDLEIREVIENKGSSGIGGTSRESVRVKEYELDWDRVLTFGDELRLRTWKPGDQYTPAAGGREGPRKLKTMFQVERIPLWDRGNWPILTVGSTIVWARQFGPAAEVAASGESRRVLLVRDEMGGRSA
jgi:tRNA(Ile)-lysidine synthetase-like protein